MELTGRGGAHFPVVRKWRAAMRAGAGGTVVINAADGEPASAKDAALLQHRAHLVLDGAAAAAEVIGAARVVLWTHEGAHATQRAVGEALVERRAAGLPDPPVHLETSPARYLSGEASAVLRALAGGPALPTFVRDPSQPWGEGNAPVLLHNAETMARVGLLTRGAGAYRPSSLVTVVSPDRRVVVDVPEGLTFEQVVRAAWPSAEPPAAVLLGGYGGVWVRWYTVAAMGVDPVALRAGGLSFGAGVIAPVSASTCGLVETARLMDYLADSGARQCGPCLNGLPEVADLADALAQGRVGRGHQRRLDSLVGQIAGRGACRHPDGALRMFTSALTAFDEDVEAHRRGRCLHPGTAPVLPLPARGA
jgi:NADH:ubiquinone oxidoreductase subunit F (NADH-binding)